MINDNSEVEDIGVTTDEIDVLGIKVGMKPSEIRNIYNEISLGLQQYRNYEFIDEHSIRIYYTDSNWGDVSKTYYIEFFALTITGDFDI